MEDLRKDDAIELLKASNDGAEWNRRRAAAPAGYLIRPPPDNRNAYYFDLSDANLNGAKLRGVDLHIADLRGADLSEADLSEANLEYAILTGANLRDCGLGNGIRTVVNNVGLARFEPFLVRVVV